MSKLYTFSVNFCGYGETQKEAFMDAIAFLDTEYIDEENVKLISIKQVDGEDDGKLLFETKEL